MSFNPRTSISCKWRNLGIYHKLPLVLGACVLLVLLAQLWQGESRTPPSSAKRPIVMPESTSVEVAVTGFQHLHRELAAFQPPKTGYRFPKVIVQTVKNKSAIPCEVLDNIKSWRDMNPGYRYMLFDNQDILRFMHKYHPQWLDTFRSLTTPVERTDMWRYLALYTYGGVYADSDVKCLKPIDEWNAENNRDAQVLIGLEGTAQNWHRGNQFQQWTIASTANHTLLGSMPRYINVYIREHPSHSGSDSILKRTGPHRWTDAILDYMEAVGKVPPHEALQQGVRVADIRVMPIKNMALGWGEPCSKVAEEPRAYLCHQFMGQWKDVFYFQKSLSGGCVTPHELVGSLAV